MSSASSEALPGAGLCRQVWPQLTAGVRTGEGPAPQREGSSGDTSVCLHRQHMSVSMWPEDVVCVIPDLESSSSPHPRALRSAH